MRHPDTSLRSARLAAVVAATAALASLSAPAGAGGHGDAPAQHAHRVAPVMDTRIALGLSPQMRTHQLANMRSHVVAIQAIVGLIAQGDFEKAADVAHSQLGLTPEMETMCNRFENEDFRKLGLRFHESADSLAQVLRTGDARASLRALQATMGYCVQCHATFRQ